ncbi:MAG TPA: hypothetical protein VLV85_06710 [Stellaceae bacterium]|nr:hypothetical protein [Stellaceae bacterium]
MTATEIENIIRATRGRLSPGGRLQIGTMAGFISERVAGFLLECVAGFIGIRSPAQFAAFDSGMA